MNRLKKYLLLFVGMVSAISIQAQTEEAVPKGFMQSNGKIYVVVAVVVTILLGLFFYVYNLDRKITRLEKANKNV